MTLLCKRVLLHFVLLAAFTENALASAPAGAGWLSSLPEASAKAQSSGKMLLLDFGADWCGPCNLMEVDVYTPAFLTSIANRVVPVRIDIEKQEKLARRYSVDTLPTIVFTDAAGGELFHHTGSLSAKIMDDILKALPTDMTAINTLATQLAESKDNPDVLASMGDALRKSGLFIASRGYYLRALPHATSRREAILNGLALDDLDLRQGTEASKWLKRCLKEFPGSSHVTDWQVQLASAHTFPSS